MSLRQSRPSKPRGLIWDLWVRVEIWLGLRDSFCAKGLRFDMGMSSGILRSFRRLLVRGAKLAFDQHNLV